MTQLVGPAKAKNKRRCYSVQVCDHHAEPKEKKLFGSSL
eukprot:CAMPEP_0197694052 /NCGR_PEP_ID=MMETSP1338-20131121/113329_1 /TAXON_ID=43686 ORGANISM="Pelagodinium beii, Strain RCC1491" /NCGR_SAMPLE_ID=MMETSP1338 /ASSEMBLY_ACC=CAM_ASM_000754 /LENGTH=38 /DNA_ID= /DNA_START= /DNA_END= /DNA_ORIENTATION=